MALEHAPQITLIGFSMGARLALSVLAEMPSEITRVGLLAPEGLGAKGMQLALAIPPKLHRQLEPLFNWLLPLPNWRILPSATQHFLQANLTAPTTAIACSFTGGCSLIFLSMRRELRYGCKTHPCPVDIAFLGENDVLVDPKP